MSDKVEPAEGLPPSTSERPADGLPSQLGNVVVDSLLETDPGKAEFIAYAGAGQRQLAAGYRADVALLEEALDECPGAPADDDLAAYRAGVDAQISDALEKAAEADKEADGIEGWAAVLYDKPPSSDFRIAYNVAGIGDTSDPSEFWQAEKVSTHSVAVLKEAEEAVNAELDKGSPDYKKIQEALQTAGDRAPYYGSSTQNEIAEAIAIWVGITDGPLGSKVMAYTHVIKSVLGDAAWQAVLDNPDKADRGHAAREAYHGALRHLPHMLLGRALADKNALKMIKSGQANGWELGPAELSV